MSDVLTDIIEQGRINSQHPALKDLERELMYGELIDEVSHCAAALKVHGVREGDRVALLLPNSVDFVVAALATLWLGAIFVPLATTDPDVRLATMIADATPRVVITNDELSLTASSLTWLGSTPLAQLSVLSNSTAASTPAIGPSSRGAYAMYTSGTTGTPKGVLVGTDAFSAAVEATANALNLTSETRTLCVSPFYFDGSFATLFPTLLRGGIVVIRPFSPLHSRTFVGTVLDERITYTGFSPSFLRLLLTNPQLPQLANSALDIIALGGEACSIDDLNTFWSIAPKVRVFNRYGPTETTIVVTHQLVTPALVETGTVPIGVPHPNVTFFLIDHDGSLIADRNRTGELYIGGSQLMSGYWGAPALTAEVLRSDVVPGEMVYRSGDLVFRDENDNYVYVDRADRVINRNGVRISLVELGEVIHKMQCVDASACVTFDFDGELGIVAFVVTNQPVTDRQLRQGSLLGLPEAMLPDRFVQVNELPVNKSNKLDEQRLLLEAGLRPLSRNGA